MLGGGAAAGVVLLGKDNPAPATPTSRTSRTAATAGAALSDQSAADGYLAGAASDIAAVTTYDYRHLDDALAAGLAVTTGGYQAAYRSALTGQLAEAVRRAHAVHTFTTLALGIGEVTGNSAKVLVFGTQTVSDSTTGSGGTSSPITLCATIVHTGDRYLISDLVAGASAGLPPGGADLPVAAEAARDEIVNLLSYRRAEFEADLQHALDGATGALRSEIQSNAVQTRDAMVHGNYDLSGAVTAVGVERASRDAVTLLVAADASRLIDGQAPVITQMRYEVTVTRAASGWAASQIVTVGGG